MGSLVDESPEAEAWIEAAVAAHAGTGIYGSVKGSVVWSDSRDSTDSVILPFDPADVVVKLNERRLPLLRDHDPGRPIGQVLEAAQFTTAGGRAFVAAVLGFYDATILVGFAELGIDTAEVGGEPERLSPLSENFRLMVEADEREVSRLTMADLTREMDVPVEVTRRSHNSAEVAQQLIVFGVPFALLVWNPFVKTFAQEAAKDAYKLARGALKTLVERVGILDNPVVEIQARQYDCTVSFIIRGKSILTHSKANASLSEAALRAHKLLVNLRSAGLKPERLVYEFDRADELWVPSFAELTDGRLVSDHLSLIAVEDLPTGLSLGLTVQSELDCTTPNPRLKNFQK